jgi:metal-responsive CopG/Arc/MetJ family transcriptional regulator
MQRTSWFIPKPLLLALKRRAKKDGVRQSDLVRRALEEFLRK